VWSHIGEEDKAWDQASLNKVAKWKDDVRNVALKFTGRSPDDRDIRIWCGDVWSTSLPTRFLIETRIFFWWNETTFKKDHTMICTKDYDVH